MSRVIYKYTVTFDEMCSFELNPADSIVLVASQTGGTADGVQMWVEYDRAAFHRSMRHFRIVATGQSIEDDERYVGTAMCPPFVWHVVEVIS